MTSQLRITKEEQKLFQEKCIELNKKLIGMGKAPVRESELMHYTLMNGGKHLTVSPKGEIKINELG